MSERYIVADGSILFPIYIKISSRITKLRSQRFITEGKDVVQSDKAGHEN